MEERASEDAIAFQICNVLHGWLRGQKNEQQNNASSPKKHRLLAVPFWIVERAREPKTHNPVRLERGEINVNGNGIYIPHFLYVYIQMRFKREEISAFQLDYFARALDYPERDC